MFKRSTVSIHHLPHQLAVCAQRPGGIFQRTSQLQCRCSHNVLVRTKVDVSVAQSLAMQTELIGAMTVRNSSCFPCTPHHRSPRCPDILVCCAVGVRVASRAAIALTESPAASPSVELVSELQ